MKLETLHDLNNEDYSDHKTISKNMFETNTLTAFFGVSNVTKSLFTYYTICCLLKGEQIPGFPIMKGKYRKIALFTKVPKRKIIRRMKKIAEALDLARKYQRRLIVIRDDNIIFGYGRKKETTFPEPDLKIDLAKSLETRNVEYIVIDALEDFHKSDENDNIQMTMVMQDILKLCESLPCGALIIAHAGGYGRSKKSGRDRWRGATSAFDKFDVKLEFFRLKKGEEKFRIIFDEMKDFPVVYPAINYTIDPKTLLPVMATDPISENVKRFCKGGVRHKDLLSRVMNLTHLAKSNAVERIKRLTEEGHIRHIGEGKAGRYFPGG